MNARSGVVLVLGLALLGLVLLTWGGVLPSPSDPSLVTREGTVVSAAESGGVTPPVGEEPDAGSGHRRTAADGEGVQLRVFDAADQLPLVDATVAWCLGTGGQRTEVADRDGVVRLPCAIGDEVSLTVTCAGYCTLQGAWKVSESEVAVPLARGGAVELSVVDAAGKPVRDVDVVLLPPLITGYWASDWVPLQSGERPFVPKDTVVHLHVVDGVLQPAEDELILDSRLLAPHYMAHAPLRRTTDDRGVIRWSGVSIGEGYRCAVLGSRHAELQPLHESQRLQVTPKGVVVGPPPPSNMSGALTVQLDETTEATARLLGAAAVHGRIRCRKNTSVRVKLCRVEQAGGGDVSPVTTVDPVSLDEADGDGRFRFENVKPGIFAIRACWIENDHDIYFASATLRLLPGMDLDLGELAAMDGASVRVRAELHANGKRASSHEVFAAPLQATANLSFSFVPDSQSLADAITEVAAVPFGHDYMLHGVPPGRLQLQAMPRHEQATLPHVQRLEAKEVLECDVVAVPEVLSAVVEVHGGHQVEIATIDDRGDATPVRDVYAVDLSTGYVQSLTVESEVGAPSGTVILPKGRHQLWAALSIGGRWLAGICECHVTGDDRSSVRLVMRPAASVRGRVTALAANKGDGVLRWSPPAFAKQGVWLYSAVPDATGEFVVDGVPAGIELHGEGSLRALPPTTAGEVRNVGVLPIR